MNSIRKAAAIKLVVLAVALAFFGGGASAIDWCTACWNCEYVNSSFPTNPDEGYRCDQVWDGRGSGCYCEEWQSPYWNCATSGGACYAVTTLP